MAWRLPERGACVKLVFVFVRQRITMNPKNMILRVSFLGWVCAAVLCGQAAQQPTAPASLTVSGDIASTLVLSSDDLAKMPRETMSVQDQDGTKIDYEGVSLREILKR